jgi:hypothetical protein
MAATAGSPEIEAERKRRYGQEISVDKVVTALRQAKSHWSLRELASETLTRRGRRSVGHRLPEQSESSCKQKTL